MTCDAVDELLSDLMDGELADGARAAIEDHLASCDSCAASYKRLRRTVRFVRANASVDLAPGTAGDAYMSFSRALVDAGYARTGEEVVRDEGYYPQEGDGP
jgi:hypothetical protein